MILLPFEKPKIKWDKVPICYPATLPNSKYSILEIGPGRGDFLFYLAEKNPKSNVIGIELKSTRYFKLIERINKRKLNNVRVIQSDARKIVSDFLPPESINEIHINFPDPWPKRKHKKNRLINVAFIKNCERILSKGGKLTFITDAEFYFEEVKKDFATCGKNFKALEVENAPFPTFFADKWKKLGRKFFMMEWQKI